MAGDMELCPVKVCVLKGRPSDIYAHAAGVCGRACKSDMTTDSQ